MVLGLGSGEFECSNTFRFSTSPPVVLLVFVGYLDVYHVHTGQTQEEEYRYVDPGVSDFLLRFNNHTDPHGQHDDNHESSFGHAPNLLSRARFSTLMGSGYPHGWATIVT